MQDHLPITWTSMGHVLNIASTGKHLYLYMFHQRMQQALISATLLLRKHVEKRSNFFFGMQDTESVYLNVSWWRNQMDTFSALLDFVRGIHRSPLGD